MSIESKIAEILAESKTADLESQVMAEDVAEEIAEEELKPAPKADEPNNKKNNVDKNPQSGEKSIKEEDEVSEEEEIVAEAEVVAEAPEDTYASLKAAVQEDVDALLDGEELSEEFKQKASTIFEAAVIARVKAETARFAEEFEARLEEESAKNKEGLVDQVDGYLGYVAEQWISNNELALESGMKAEILEGFVGGLKGLFEEHYIDIPEERFDVLGSMEEHIQELEEKLDEAVAANVEMSKTIAESQRKEIIAIAADGLSVSETEKFEGLAEELSFENAESFAQKVQTIRESYFSKKEKSETIVESVVTDEPVEEVLTEAKKPELDPRMAAFVAALNKK
jgi:hypothetical protein